MPRPSPPLDLHYGREAKAQDESKTDGAASKETGPSLQRALGKKAWVHHYESDSLRLVREAQGGDLEGVQDAEETLRATAPKGDGDDDGDKAAQGFTDEEVKAAVATAKKGTDAKALYDAVWVLREVTGEGEEGAMRVIQMRALPSIVKLLKMSDPAVEEDAAVCLLNMVAHEHPRLLLSDQGLILPLVEALQASSLSSTKANIAATLGLVVRKQTDIWLLLTSGALPALLEMLKIAKKKAETDEDSSVGPPAFPRSTSSRPTPQGGLLFSPSISSAGDTTVHDACLALMHFAKFHVIQVALLKLGAISLLAGVAKVARIVDAEQSLVVLFQFLTKAEGGPEAICLEHNGTGADALIYLAINGADTTQDLALDTLMRIASSNIECLTVLLEKGLSSKLEAEGFLEYAPKTVERRALALKSFLNAHERLLGKRSGGSE